MDDGAVEMAEARRRAQFTYRASTRGAPILQVGIRAQQRPGSEPERSGT